MSGFGAGLAGFASGLSGGMALGQRLNTMVEDDKLQKVREQGIAEAKALQAKAAPQVQDLGDQQNLTSNPQSSRDPNAQPEAVNTSLQQFQNNAQAQADGGPGSMPVAAPQVQDANTLSDKPLASAAPGAQVADTEAPSPFAKGLPQGARKRFNVDGAEFDTQEEAAAHVKKSTPALASFFKTTLIPKMSEELIRQGKPDQAAAWEKYADEEQTKTNMATWGKALRLAQFGDHTSAAQELMKLHPHFDDGFELVNSEPTKGPNGADGFTMTVKGPDGKEQQMYQDAKTITELGLSQLSPIEMFNKRFQRQTQADTLAAREAIDERNDKRTENRMLGATKLREEGQNTRADKRIEATKEVTATKIEANKDRDASRASSRMEQIREKARLDADRIAKSGEFRKAVSPEERRAIIVAKKAGDPMFGMKSKDEQSAEIDQIMALIPQPGATAAPARNTVSNPFQQGGISPAAPGGPAPAPAGKRAVTVYDPATQQMKTVFR